MGGIIKNNKLVVLVEPKTIHFYLPKVFRNNLKHEIDFIIKQNDFLAEQTINENSQLFSKKHGVDINEHRKQ